MRSGADGQIIRLAHVIRGIRVKQLLLATTVLSGTVAASAPAWAAEPIKLSVGGFFREAYLVVFDDDAEGEAGNEQNTDGFFNDAEIHFVGSTVLDNGLEVGARVELEGENDGDQIDEAWVWFSGGFGELRVGSEDEALANACIVPPGGTANFSAFSPNQWGANAPLGSNTVCTGVDDDPDAQKVVYISPVFGGFQITASYTPDSVAETHGDGAGPHVGMPDHFNFTSRHNASVYLTYGYEGDGWGLTWGGGASFEGHAENFGAINNPREQDFYQTGLNLTVGNFAAGIVGEYFHDLASFDFSSGPSQDSDAWAVGVGVAYTYAAWTFGAQYSHQETDTENIDGFANLTFDTVQDRAVVTGLYRLGPGITVDAEIAYTWTDIDPNDLGFGTEPAAGYDALELGIGTAITF